MLSINHAILHVFDFDTTTNYKSATELDLDSKQMRSYLTRMVRKTLNSADNQEGSFSDDSNFAQELRAYAQSEMNFIPFSQEIADFFFGELQLSEDKAPMDLLVVDATNTEKPQEREEDSEEELAVDHETPAERLFAIILLNRKQGYLHSLLSDTATSIERSDALLPNPTQKLDSYAVIHLRDLSIAFVDKTRSIAGQDSMVIPDGLLQCTKSASVKKVIETLTSTVEDVAQEYGLTPAVEVSRAKACVTEQAEESEVLEPHDVGKKIFVDHPEAQTRYEEKLEALDAEVPQEVHVRPSVAHRMAKNHRIRTDTGIEIIFPSEYSSTDQYIEFTNLPDGHISITIKGVEHIENR